jgi:hypothetical protein
MGGGFLSYLQQLEMLAFFSGYPLIYLIVQLLARNQTSKNRSWMGLISLLPFAYALVGTLYLGLQIRNLYPDYSIQNIKFRVPQPYLNLWGILSILFWIPSIARKIILSILHSLVFFFFIPRDIFFQLAGINSDRNIVVNDMRIYTVSLFLNMAAFTLIVLITLLSKVLKKQLKP